MGLDREKWMRKEFSRWERLCNFVRSLRHRLARAVKREETTLQGFVAWLLAGTARLTVALAPLLISLLSGAGLRDQPWWMHALVFGPIGALGYLELYERSRKWLFGGRLRRQQQKLLTWKLSRSITEFRPFVKVSAGGREAVKRSLHELLECIMLQVSLALRGDGEDWQVNLFVFEDDCKFLRVQDRANPQFGGTVGPFQAAGTVILATAITGECRAVDDCRSSSPFEFLGNPAFRSKLLCPLVVIGSDQKKQHCLGVVSIENGGAYRFCGSNGPLLTILEPYLAFLKVMLANRETRLEVKDYGKSAGSTRGDSEEGLSGGHTAIEHVHGAVAKEPKPA